MRAITIRNPWAWAILYAGKNVENRSRNIAGAYRGPVAIHAGLREDEDAFYDDMIKDALGQFDDSWLLEEQMVPGAFIGVADLVDVHIGRPARGVTFAGQPVCFKDGVPIGQRCSPWAQNTTETHHLVLERPRLLPKPIPCRGRLGLWTPPPELAAAMTVVAR